MLCILEQSWANGIILIMIYYWQYIVNHLKKKCSNVAMLTAHYKSEHIGLLEKSLLFQVWWIILYTSRKPNTDRGQDWLGTRGYHCLCATCLVNKTAFYKTFEGSTLLSVSQRLMRITPFLSPVTAKAHTCPPLEWANEILKGPGEREDDLLRLLFRQKTAVSNMMPSDQRLGHEHSWVPLSSIRGNCEEGLGL